MPLDNAGTVTFDPLQVMGITAIDQKAVAAYKKAYRLAQPPGHRWQSLKKSKAAPLGKFLRDPFRDQGRLLLGLDTHGPAWNYRAFGKPGVKNPAPEALIALAERVHAEIPEAQFVVDYLGYDPILQVVYHVDGKRQKACLGIWDSGVLKAIAATE